MATQVIGSVAINNLLPIQSRAAGQVAFGPIAIPAGYTGVSFLFDLQQITTLTATLSVTLELSLDGGANFAPAGGYGLDLSQSGYVLVNNVITRNAQDAFGPGPVRYFGSMIRLTHCELTTRVIRGTLSATEALVSGVTVTAV